MIKVTKTDGSEYSVQVLMLDTVMGPQPRFAPDGWTFDKTAVIAWARILFYAKSIKDIDLKPKMTQKDIARLEAKLDVLADVLATSLGMAPFYWSEAAKDFARVA